MFGVVAETTPRKRNPGALTVPRYDWVGRPEQTNFILNVIPDSVDLRDVWNQQTPFQRMPDDVAPLFQKRLRDSFELWDKRDGETHWDPALLNAHINVRIDDFLVFDICPSKILLVFDICCSNILLVDIIKFDVIFPVSKCVIPIKLLLL
jgi:hypothetical protein